MLPDKQTIIACTRRAAAAAFIAVQISALQIFAPHSFASHSAARAEPLAPALFDEPGVVPEFIAVAAPSATPVAIPAVVTPASHPPVASPLKPAVAPPAASSPVAPTSASAPPAPTNPCTAPAQYSQLTTPLVHTMRRLASGEPLTIVAVGSSSTAGAGASSPAATYPSRLAVELQARFPGHDVTVLNRGVNGDETDGMLARFQADVIAAHPQLVLWQVGTNSVLRDRPLAPHLLNLQQGIRELKAINADIVLIDPQYSPAVIAKIETADMVEQIARVAKEDNVDLFRRFAVMRNWHDVQRLPFDVFVSPDQLHMNDWSYACVAKLLATAITEAATRPVASAAAHPVRSANSP